MIILSDGSQYTVEQLVAKHGKVVAREAKHITYSAHTQGESSDCLVVKEWLTFADSTRLPNLKSVIDYERPIWITKPQFRTHPDKIPFEDLDRLDRWNSTQINLPRLITEKLGRQAAQGHGLRAQFRPPFTYGGDQGPEVYYKQRYLDKWPDAFKPNVVTVADAETDVYKPGFQPILWSEVNDDEIILYYNKSWSRDIFDYEGEVRKIYHEALPGYVDALIKKMADKEKGTYPAWIDSLKQLPLRFVQGEDSLDITTAMVQNWHRTQPDFLTGWNFQFDMNAIYRTIFDGGMDPVHVLSDPRVPPEYRMALLKDGPREKVSAAGRKVNLGPQERWDISLLTASFRPQDSMQLYWQLRKAKGKEPGGYGLDTRATDQLGIGKMHFSTADSDVPSGTMHWHMEMQKYYKVPYGGYAIFDSISVWAMNKKNSDLSSQISSLAGPLDYSQFWSQPKINCASMLFDTIKARGKVICTTSDEMETEFDSLTMSREGWIVAFPAHNIAEDGYALFSDMPTVLSRVYKFASDADVETTYPICEIILNLGRETTISEPCRIRGVSVEQQRRLSVNLTGGAVNSIEILQAAKSMTLSMDDYVERIRAKHYPDKPKLAA